MSISSEGGGSMLALLSIWSVNLWSVSGVTAVTGTETKESENE